MKIQSITPVLLLVAPFVIAFFMEALVIFFFRLKSFWASVGLSALINLLTLCVLFGAGFLVGQLGYVFSGLRLPLPVVFMFWWLSVMVDGLLLQAFARRASSKQVYLASIVMNTISYVFLYVFIANSH